MSANEGDGSLTEEQAAVKIEAMARGKKDRAKVKQMREDKKKDEDTKTDGDAKTGEDAKKDENAKTDENAKKDKKDQKQADAIKKEKAKTEEKKKRTKERPKRPTPKKSIVSNPSPRVRTFKSKQKQKEEKEAEAKAYKERIERETADLSARYLKEITSGVINMPSEFYPDINSAVRRARDSSGGIKSIHLGEGRFEMTEQHHAGFNSCMLDFPVELVGESSEKTILVGMFELISNGKCKADKNGSLIYEGTGIIFTNLTITNPTDKHKKATEQPTTRGVWSDRGLPLTMNYCQVTLCKGDGLYVRGGSYIRMNRCHVHKNKCQGVFLSGAGTRGCLVDLEANHNGDSALYVNRGADIDLRGFKTFVHHNGMYKESRYGLKASGTDSDIRIHLPQSHDFLVNNGLHVKKNQDDEVHKDKVQYEISPKAKDMAEEFGGKIRYIKLNKKQLASFTNFLNRGNEEDEEKRRKLHAQGFLTFPKDFPNMTEAVKFAQNSKGKIKEIVMAPGSHDFKGTDCHISFPVTVRGSTKGGDERVEVLGEFVIEGDPLSSDEVVLDNLIIHAPEGYSLLSEGGRPTRLVNCEVANSEETAIHVSSGSRLTMVKCHVHHCAHDGVYVEGNGSSARLTDCHIHHIDGGAAIYAGDGATITVDGTDTNIHDNFTGIQAEDSGSKVMMDMIFDPTNCHDNRVALDKSKSYNFSESKGGIVLYVDKDEETKRRESDVKVT